MTRAIDYTALTAPVAPAEVAAFKATARSRRSYSTASMVIGLILGITLFGCIALTVALLTSMALGSAGEMAGLPNLSFPLFLVIMAAAVLIAVRIARRSGKWESWYRLDRFATANGLVFSPQDANPQYPGTIFQQGRDREAIDHLRSASGRFLDYGNYRYTTGSGKSQRVHTWGFMALELDRALPNMILDSRSNNGLFGSNLPATFSKDQVLKLEGDFNEHFTLYCPKQYERDALYVFTPDLMALLIDNAAPFDVEIVDDWMLVYSSSTFDLKQPGLHQRLLGIVDTVGAKTLSQTGGYRDERVGDPTANLIAPQGRRLKQRLSVGVIIALAIAVLGWLLPFISDLLGR